MKWKKIIISVVVGFLSVVIVTSFASAKFRGGSVIDVARVAKETQKVIEETKILSEITTLHDLQEEFFKVLDDLGQLENDVLTVVEEANILSNSVNGIIGAQNTYQAKVENLYGDTWFELGLGTNIKLSDNSYFYGDIENGFGDIKKKWQINAGVRFNF